jgi:hypothetical protein
MILLQEIKRGEMHQQPLILAKLERPTHIS